MLQELEEHIVKRYEILERLGKGAYGIVWKAIDRKQRKIVAIKKIIQAFHNASDAQRTYREIMVLKQLNGHPNLVRLLNVFRSDENRDIYLIYQQMQTDLHIVIKSSAVTLQQKLFISYQMIKGLAFLHQARIIHRDIKPSNILIDKDCFIKIADFGLSRVQPVDGDLTDYVATRWYRAPQILLGSSRYSFSSDIWGLGCSIAQLYNGESLFKGNNTIHQIEKVLQFTGKPNSKDLDAINSPLAADIISTLSIKKKHSSIKYPNPVIKKLIEGMLTLNPEKRLTAEEALKCECFEKMREWDTCHLQANPIKLNLDDTEKLPLREYREEIYKQIQKREKELSIKWKNYLLNKLQI